MTMLKLAIAQLNYPVRAFAANVTAALAHMRGQPGRARTACVFILGSGRHPLYEH